MKFSEVLLWQICKGYNFCQVKKYWCLNSQVWCLLKHNYDQLNIFRKIVCYIINTGRLILRKSQVFGTIFRFPLFLSRNFQDTCFAYLLSMMYAKSLYISRAERYSSRARHNWICFLAYKKFQLFLYEKIYSFLIFILCNFLVRSLQYF